MEEVRLYLCVYQYAGQETEGQTTWKPPFICKAENETEALWKYHVWITWKDKSKLYWKSFQEYRQCDYAAGGWGFMAYKLGAVYQRDDVGDFKTILASYA
jgi:hypothetical protein